jgi:hypothetical protein
MIHLPATSPCEVFAVSCGTAAAITPPHNNKYATTISAKRMFHMFIIRNDDPSEFCMD